MSGAADALIDFTTHCLQNYLEAVSVFADPCAFEVFPTSAYRLVPMTQVRAGYRSLGILVEIPDVPHGPSQLECVAEHLREALRSHL